MASRDSPTSTVEKRKNWTGIILSSIFGGAVAVTAAPIITLLLPAGAVYMCIGTMTTGILGSVVTKVTGNAIDSSAVTITIHQHPVQHFYRQTIVQYIGTTLENVILSVRTNCPQTVHNRIHFDIGNEFCFQGVSAQERQRMFFDFTFRVVPLSGSQRRVLEDSVPPEDLPLYSHDSTRTFTVGTGKSLLEGTTRAMVEGALFGAAGGALAKGIPVLARTTFIPTVPGKVGIIVGMSSATGVTGPLKNLAFPSTEPDRAALFVEFATEAERQVHRLTRCAVLNGVGLEVNMMIGSTSDKKAKVGLSEINGVEDCRFYWSHTETIGFE